MSKDDTIRCDCGKTIFSPVEGTSVYILKSIAVAQFAGGKVNIKCRNCKRWIEGLDQKLFLKE